MKKSGSQKSKSPSQLIDAKIRELGDWRGKMLSRIRTLVKEADPEVVEEWKWRVVPVWSHDGLIEPRRDTQECREDDFRQRGDAEGSFAPLQLQSGGEHKACHRLPRGREDRREGVEDFDRRRRDLEQVHKSLNSQA